MTHISPEDVARLLEGTTPGPWAQGGLMVRGDDQYVARADMMRRPIGDDGMIEAAANATLIAAAPSIARAYVALAERVGVLEEALETVMLNNRTGAVGQIAREGWAKARAALTLKEQSNG